MLRKNTYFMIIDFFVSPYFWINCKAYLSSTFAERALWKTECKMKDTMCTEKKLSLSSKQVILFPSGRKIAPGSFCLADPRHTNEETSSSSWKFNFWQVFVGLDSHLAPPLPVLIWPPKPPSGGEKINNPLLSSNTFFAITCQSYKYNAFFREALKKLFLF